jgi:hypothetical protein
MKSLFSDKAQMKIWSGVTNRVAMLDEDEVDNLLRVVECAADPREDLAEFMNEALGFKIGQYALACLFVDYAKDIARMVYA